MVYQYDLEFRSTHQHANADGFSRLPRAPEDHCLNNSDTAFNLYLIDSGPYSSRQLREATYSHGIHVESGMSKYHRGLAETDTR